MTPFRIAHIDSTHGLRGEVSAVILTDFPERFAELDEVRVGTSNDVEPRRLQGWRLHRRKVLLKIEGCDGIEAAQSLIGCDVWIDAAAAIELPEGSYYHQDLIGLEVRDLVGRKIGQVEDILLTGGTDVLRVDSGGEEVLIPAARSICVEVNVEGGFLIVDPPEGLLEVNAS